MRESNFQFPSQNRAVVSITHMLYDRRALDTGSPLAILNNLTSLTYLTSTSPRIREILTLDGGLERLLDILRESTLPRQTTLEADLWGLNGPPTARVISVDRQTLLKHSLAFQCVVNIGVRGSEQIRTRVVQGGALDLVAQILESWLKEHGIAIFASTYGSQIAVDAVRSGQPIPGALERRRRTDGSRSQAAATATTQSGAGGTSSRTNSITSFLSNINPRSLTRLDPSRLAGGLFPRAAARQEPAPAVNQLAEALVPVTRTPVDRGEEADVDMAEGEADIEMDGSSIGADESMDLDEPPRAASEPPTAEAGPSTTPRASRLVLPMTMTQPIPIRPAPRETPSQASSATGSVSDAGEEPIPRIISDSNLQAASEPRAPGFIGDSRLTHLGHAAISTQSSPAGTPTRAEMGEGRHRRRDTIVARPLHLVPRNERDRGDAGSEMSDGGPDVDIMTATIAAGVAAAQNLAGEGGIADVQDGGNEDRLDVAMPPDDGIMGEPDQEALEREQARLDMEAGAPPTQLAAAAAAIQQTPMADAPTPRQQTVLPPAAAIGGITATAPGAAGGAEEGASIIIASGAPRGFQDLGSYVGISSLLHPDGDRYSDDSILLALQLLAYLSKYPHVRAAFHHPRRPMHPTFDLSADPDNPLPERPACSETPNIFALVERFTFKPSPSEPLLFKVPKEIHYWAGVIMRNACRKDDLRGGIRQCAHMSCGKWENYAREFAKCRRCRKAKYCSKECQSRAWSEGHKYWCSARGDGEGPGGHGAGGPDGGGGGGPRPPQGEDEDNDSDFSNMDPPRDRDRQRRERRGDQGHGGNGTGRAAGGAAQTRAPNPPGGSTTQEHFSQHARSLNTRMRRPEDHDNPVLAGWTPSDSARRRPQQTSPRSLLFPSAPTNAAELAEPSFAWSDWVTDELAAATPERLVPTACEWCHPYASVR